MSLDLSSSGTRIYLHVPRKYSLIYLPIGPNTILITSSQVEEPVVPLGTTTRFLISQMSQNLLNSLAESNPLFIIEVSPIWKEFIFPRGEGRFVAFGSDVSSLDSFIGTSCFLNGLSASNVNLMPLDAAIFLKTIGMQSGSESNPFLYQGIPIPIRMNQAQYNEYLLKMEQDSRSKKFAALQVTNFLYPPHKSGTDLPKKQGGWIDTAIAGELSRYSPKLFWIAHYIQENRGKHIIHTAFNDSNGVQLVSTILRILGHNVVSLTGNDRQTERKGKLEEFTEILVTNLCPFTDLREVDSLIMLEQFSDDSVINGYLNRANSNLKIYFLISFGPNNELTLEVTNYLEVIRKLNARDVLVKLLRTGTADLEEVRQWFEVPLLTGQELSLKISGPL